MVAMKNFNSSSIRLWQLISPTLPIGSFCYSQGMEYAVESGWVTDEQSASEWILGQLKNNLSVLDVPLFLRLYDAWQSNDIETVKHWNDIALALRESSELYQQDCTLGQAMSRLLEGLDAELPELDTDRLALITVFSFACQHWSIDRLEAVHGLLWSWCENQVAAAIKLVPLGQTSGQRIMSMAIEAISISIEKGLQCDDDDIGLLAPGLAIASALHETQYTRLFRS